MLLFSLYILSVHRCHRFRLIRRMMPIRYPTDIYSVFIPLIYLYNAKRPIDNFEEPPMGYFLVYQNDIMKPKRMPHLSMLLLFR